MNRRPFRADPKDHVIVIMGPTGSGKTNFINRLTENEERHAAGRLRSDTQDVTPYPVMRGEDRFVFVDTPGFDDTYRPDSQILRIVADWLTQKYANGLTLHITGIIYLHRITDNRMSGSVYKNLRMFGRLCGDLPLRRVRLVTTMWDGVKDPAKAESREIQLKGEFWKKLLDEGAKARRFDNTWSGAWGIVRELKDPGDNELLLQEEIVAQHKRVNETEAGKVLYSRFQQLLAEQKKVLQDLADEAAGANDSTLTRSLREEYDRVDAHLQKVLDQLDELKISFFRRMYLWLFSPKSRGHAVDLDDELGAPN